MNSGNSNNRHYDRSGPAGFTLAEVAIAIVILSGSLVVLLGLQYSVVQRTLRDRTKITAMLIARNILSGIEVDQETVDEQDTIKPAFQMAQDLLGFTYEADELSELDRGINARLMVQKLEIPRPDSNPVQLKRVFLRLFWSEDPLDSFDVVYFIPGRDEQTPKEADNE